MINRKKKGRELVTKLRCPFKNEMATSPTEISNIFNKHFSYIGEKLSAKLPNSSKHFSYYLNTNNYPNSFFFKPVTSSEVESEINSMPCGKTNGLYSCPMRILKCIKESISSKNRNIKKPHSKRRLCFFVSACFSHARKPHVPCNLRWQVSAFEFQYKSIGKNPFGNIKMLILQDRRKLSPSWI